MSRADRGLIAAIVGLVALLWILVWLVVFSLKYGGAERQVSAITSQERT